MTRLTDEERRAVKVLCEMLEEFSQLRSNIPIHHLIVFLKIALDENHSQKHYAISTDLPASTVSRAVLDLGKKTRKGENGLGLVEASVALHSLREHQNKLTPRGASLLRKFTQQIIASR